MIFFFFKLNRALQNQFPTKSFPKKAFARLCNHAIDTGPWIRPNDETNQYCELVKSFISASTADNETHNIICNFDQRLKKSLHVVDSFLRELCNIHALFISNTNKDAMGGTESTNKRRNCIIDEWTFYCREHDTKDLITPNDHSREINETNAALLGQYFASNENAKDVNTYEDIVIGFCFHTYVYSLICSFF